MAEHLFCKQVVPGSNPGLGSNRQILRAKQQAVPLSGTDGSRHVGRAKSIIGIINIIYTLAHNFKIVSFTWLKVF